LDLDKAIRKVELLLETVNHEGTSTIERERAQEFVQRLITKYQIEEAQLFKKDVQGIGRFEVPIEGSFVLDRIILLNFIAEENFCRVLRGKNYAAIYGTELDVKFTLSLYHALETDMVVEMMAELKDFQSSTTEKFSKTSWKKSFFAGYSVRVGERLAEARRSVEEESSGNALALLDKEQAINDFWLSQNNGTAPSRILASPEGFESGRVSGSRADLGQTKITTRS